METNQPGELHVKFSAPDSAGFAYDMKNVSPLQLLALAGYFEQFARQQIAAQIAVMQAQQARKQPSLIIPQLTGIKKGNGA